MEDGRVSIVLIIKNPRALASSPISVDIYMNHTQRLDEIFLGFVSKYLAQRAASKKSSMTNLWIYIEDIGVGLTFKPHRCYFFILSSCLVFLLVTRLLDRWMRLAISPHIIFIVYCVTIYDYIHNTHNRRVCCSFIKTRGLETDAVELRPPSFYLLVCIPLPQAQAASLRSIHSPIPLKKKRRQRRSGCCDWI